MSVIPMSIHSKPSARQIQPMGLRGRLEEIRAPTTGKARKGTKTNRLVIVRSAPQLPGTPAERARTSSTPLARNMVTQRPASDQASKEAPREVRLPTNVPLRLDRSVTTATVQHYRTLKRYIKRHIGEW